MHCVCIPSKTGIQCGRAVLIDHAVVEHCQICHGRVFPVQGRVYKLDVNGRVHNQAGVFAARIGAVSNCTTNKLCISIGKYTTQRYELMRANGNRKSSYSRYSDHRLVSDRCGCNSLVEPTQKTHNTTLRKSCIKHPTKATACCSTETHNKRNGSA